MSTDPHIIYVHPPFNVSGYGPDFEGTGLLYRLSHFFSQMNHIYHSQDLQTALAFVLFPFQTPRCSPLPLHPLLGAMHLELLHSVFVFSRYLLCIRGPGTPPTAKHVYRARLITTTAWNFVEIVRFRSRRASRR